MGMLGIGLPRLGAAGLRLRDRRRGPRASTSVFSQA